jgi:AraC family transcriptional regulator, regulatory protein of adaptative response / DNA-3-methyladenine glycosylase II
MDTPDDDTAYRALTQRDARFDGHFFVGVTSTGIYCRPVCRVRMPKRENCRFYASRALAEAARFRPCLKCRPEIAPGLSAMDSSRALADAAARCLAHSVVSGNPSSLVAIAAHLGVTDRHLRRIFLAAHGVSPQSFLTTQRLLLAKQLLTDTQQPITQVALASGFGSLRRFNAAFLQHYRLNPPQLRRAGGLAAVPGPPQLRLAYRPPFDAPSLMAFFAKRALPGVEAVDGLTLRRTLRWQPPVGAAAAAVEGWISTTLHPERHELVLQTSPSLFAVAGAVMQQVRHLFDLNANPADIDACLQRLALPALPGLRLPGSLCGFEAAVRVILGQQVTVKAARTLVQRLVQRFGTPLETPFADLNRLFPSAAALAQADPAHIGELGIVRQRVGALQALARGVCEGHIRLQPNSGAGTDPDTAQTMDALRALPGVGEWTTQVIALRALHHPDAWPASDIGLMNALGTRNILAIEALGEPLRPWRSYAVMRLWHHLETGT